jgi:hypothetical protein
MKSSGFMNKKQIAYDINSTLVDWRSGCRSAKASRYRRKNQELPTGEDNLSKQRLVKNLD